MLSEKIQKQLDKIEVELGFGEINHDVNTLSTLRHRAHIGHLDNTYDINIALSNLGLDLEIESVEDVHDILNPILLYLEEKNDIDNLASHGCSAFYSNY